MVYWSWSWSWSWGVKLGADLIISSSKSRTFCGEKLCHLIYVEDETRNVIWVLEMVRTIICAIFFFFFLKFFHLHF